MITTFTLMINHSFASNRFLIEITIGWAGKCKAIAVGLAVMEHVTVAIIAIVSFGLVETIDPDLTIVVGSIHHFVLLDRNV